MRDTIFALSPPGDLWEAYRNWESLETGAIPIVLDVRRVYGDCDHPAVHFLATAGAAGALSVLDWSEVPALVAELSANMTSLAERQTSLLRWYRDFKRQIGREVSLTSELMAARGARWNGGTRYRASQLSPQGFAQYLREPWYAILCEWDEIEFEEAEEEGAVASVDVLVKRTADDSWTIVNWELSQHSGRWLTDALTIN